MGGIEKSVEDVIPGVNSEEIERSGVGVGVHEKFVGAGFSRESAE